MAFDVRPQDSESVELDAQPDINVTPFIDVMLVLLIIFMVTAPMMTAGLKVDLPKASSTVPTEGPRPIVVAITASGGVHVGDQPVEKDNLVPMLKQLVGTQDRPIQIRGDKAAPYGSIIAVLDLLSSGGLPKHVLVIERQTARPKR
jgi:biopolymer transport protein TolR